MFRRLGCFGSAALIAVVAAVLIVLRAWGGAGPAPKDLTVIVPEGSSLTSAAKVLERDGAIADASRFLLLARVFGSDDPIRPGEYRVGKGMSASDVLKMLQGGKTLQRFVMIPEGMPSVMVHARLMKESRLRGTIPVPEEGSILPDSYSFETGESRAAVMKRMQDAMTRTLADLWPKRRPSTAVSNIRDAVILASIVEKETGVPSERRMVAGVYSNRVKQGMKLQADPTIIYPVTRGRPLGRRILRSELNAVNGYNTYTMTGLPVGPIANPGRESIAAVLDPASTNALYFVADGSGGHVFADTLDQHNANVEKWFAIRRARGEM